MSEELHKITLPASTSFANVSDKLNAPSGSYAYFKFYYVLRRNGVQQTGEMDINDNGLEVQADHEWTVIPNNGDPGVVLRVVHQSGKRVVQYKTTGGSADVIMKFQIQHKFG